MDRPLDLADVVRAHHRRAQALVHADDAAGKKVQADYAKAIGSNRNVHALDAAALARHEPTPSWAMGAIVGPASDLAPLVAWLARRSRDAEERVRFYLLPRVRVARAFEPWYEAGFDDPRTADARDWRGIHPSFGLFFANVVYVDAKLHPEWFRA